MRWKQYVEQVAKIRALSTPEVNISMSASEYYDALIRNFTTIRELAVSNREILDEDIYPFLNQTEELLDEEIAAEFREMSESLVDAYNMENLDMMMTARIADRMYRDAVAKGDLHYIIEQLDACIEAYYTLLNMTKRIDAYSDLCEFYRMKARSFSDKLMEYYKPEAFASLPDEECKETVLVNSRYISMLYEGETSERAKKEEWGILTEALRVEKDAFYREQVPNYNWKYHRLRTLEYFAFMTELGNQKGLTVEECTQVLRYCEELAEMWDADEEVREHVSGQEVELFVLRAKFYAGQISLRNYREKLYQLYEKRDAGSYGISEIFQNVLVPLEYMLALRVDSLLEVELFRVDTIYKNIIHYAAAMPNTGSLCYLLEYFSEFMSHYIEIPGQSRFMDICLDSMAALHPPTYVHTSMVARLSKCMCRHLLNKKPELFIDVLGCRNVEEVRRRREEIELFIYHGALCHDVGKIWIMDTIFVYGRNLTDEEFTLVKTHPVVGEAVLQKYDSSKAYAGMAYGHHRWYDNDKGYPLECNTESYDEKLLIDLIACADCLDAATDSVGRSYTKKKTIEEVMQELVDQSGSRYTPVIRNLFSDEAVVSDMKYLLTEGRREMYNNTFRRLLTVQTGASN